MAEQIFTDGDIQSIGGQLFECVAVSYQHEGDEKDNFVYSFRLKSELDAEREAAQKAEEAAATGEPVVVEPVQPEVTKEETHYVK